MAPSPAARRPQAPLKIPFNPLLMLADVISYGYAAVVVFATLQFEWQFTVPEAIGVMVVFVLLRAVAHEIRKDARKHAIREARKVAALRAESPARWSAEQRDGMGRRVDQRA